MRDSWALEFASGIVYLSIPVLLSQTLSSATSLLDGLLFFSILSAYVASYLTCATSDTAGTAWRSYVGRTTLLIIACSMYIWVIVFVSIEPRLIKSKFVAFFKQFVSAWLVVQISISLMSQKVESWRHAAWGHFCTTKLAELETLEIFSRASLVVQGVWYMYLLHYSHHFAPMRLDLLVLLVMYGYRLCRRGTMFEVNVNVWRQACVKPTAPMTLLLFVIEPCLSMYAASFNVSNHMPSDTKAYLLVGFFIVVLIELACDAWETKSTLLSRVAQKKNVRQERVWSRFLPEVYDAEVSMMLALGSFALSHDWLVFAWPIVSAALSWLLHVWSEAKLAESAPASFATYTKSYSFLGEE